MLIALCAFAQLPHQALFYFYFFFMDKPHRVTILTTCHIIIVSFLFKTKLQRGVSFFTLTVQRDPKMKTVIKSNGYYSFSTRVFKSARRPWMTSCLLFFSFSTSCVSLRVKSNNSSFDFFLYFSLKKKKVTRTLDVSSIILSVFHQVKELQKAANSLSY